jgi:hypothetical protein
MKVIGTILKEIGKTVKILRYDREIEFCNKMFQNFLDNKNIKHELTCVILLSKME